jgi:predicted nucleic acid-binding Zn ribbon protein
MRFELRRRFGDSPPTTCPEGHNGVHRVFAPPTIIFKGSGFYVTDNRSSNKSRRKSDKDKKPSETKKQEKKEKATTGEKS